VPLVNRDDSKERKETTDLNKTSLKWTKIGVTSAIIISILSAVRKSQFLSIQKDAQFSSKLVCFKCFPTS